MHFPFQKEENTLKVLSTKNGYCTHNTSKAQHNIMKQMATKKANVQCCQS
jgi:hypothetical protein